MNLWNDGAFETPVLYTWFRISWSRKCVHSVWTNDRVVERSCFARRMQQNRDIWCAATTCATHLCRGAAERDELFVVSYTLHPRTLTPRCPVCRVDPLSLTLSSITFASIHRRARVSLFFHQGTSTFLLSVVKITPRLCKLSESNLWMSWRVAALWQRFSVLLSDNRFFYSTIVRPVL